MLSILVYIMTWLIDEHGLKLFWSENQKDFPRWIAFGIRPMWNYAWCYIMFLVFRTKALSRKKIHYCLVSSQREKEASVTIRWAWKKKETHKKSFFNASLPSSFPFQILNQLWHFIDIWSILRFYFISPNNRHSTYHPNQFEKNA